MTTLTQEQINELKPFVVAYNEECEAFDAKELDFSSAEALLDYRDDATQALINKLNEMGLPVNLNTVDEVPND